MAKEFEKIKWYGKMYGMGKTCRYLKNKVLYGYMDDYPRWQKKHAISEAELAEQRETHFEKEPLISIVVPLYKTPVQYLAALVESVKAQTYVNWELCLSDGSGKSESDNDAGGAVQTPLRAMLGHLQGADSRIHVVTSDTPLGISDNTNQALSIAKGEYIAFADHDDLLAPNALYENVKEINKHPDVQFIYSDEDKVDGSGKRYFMPHFKPDFNLDLLRARNYICHLVVVSRELYEKIGGLNAEFDGAQDHDFVFRCVEAVPSNQIRHIPKTLYHWRAYGQSTAEGTENKDYANDAGFRARLAHFARMGIPVELEPVQHGGVTYPDMCRVRYQVAGGRDDEFVLIKSEEVQAVTEDLFQDMMGYCSQQDVGAVGAKVYAADGTVFHAGGMMREDGTMCDAFSGLLYDEPGYFGRAIIAQDTSAVSSLCWMVKKSVLEAIGESDKLTKTGSKLSQQDVTEICIKIREAGYRIVFDAFAEVTCGSNIVESKVEKSRSPIQDLYYNSNLEQQEAGFDY